MTARQTLRAALASALRSSCALALGLSLAACASEPERRPLGELDYPGLLRSPEVATHDVLWRQRVTAHWPDGSRGFDAALQIEGGVLTLLGLSPIGAPGFVITQTGTAIEARNDTGHELPFPPRFIVLDVQRVFFPWIAEPADTSGDAETTGVVGGERVTERWSGGRLAERTFERLDGRPAGEITVRYEWGDQPRLAPARAELDNGWFGYRLEIETVEETLLPAARS